MTVYTVSSTDDLSMEPLDRCVTGTYTTRGKALDECVQYIMERLRLRDDLAWSMARDENHPEAKRFFSERRKDGATIIRKGCVNKLREFIRDELGGQGCYYVWDGENSWHFDVDENDLCGDAWSLVTWGDSDVEDPDFTTPFPELFTDEDKAVANAVKYARDLMKSHDFRRKDIDDNLAYIRDALRLDGRARLDLNDGTAVHWVLYHFGMETENTDAGKRFCRKCGHELSTENVSPGYRFYCPNCDEDMYGIEARRR